MTRAHLARRSAWLIGTLVLGLVAVAPVAAPSHAQGSGLSNSCITLGGYTAATGVYFDYPYIGGTVGGYGFGHGYPWYSQPYPIWGGGFGYVPYTYYPAVGTPSAGVAPGFLPPINAYNNVPGPIGSPIPAGMPYSYDLGYPYPPTYPWSSYPQYGGQPTGSFTGFWDPFYAGRGAGLAGQFGYGC
jgi:hypothetical protein